MKLVPTAVTKVVAKQALVTSANAPKALFVVGVAGSVCSTVLACRATLKLDEVLETTREDLYVAKNIEHKDYTESDRSHDTVLIYARSVTSIAKLYAPAVLVGAASVAALTKSHNLLQERNLALTAAYAAIDRAYEGYRAQVVEKYGEDEDRELRQRAATQELASYDDAGQPVPHKVDPNQHSVYARFFDEYSGSWSKEPEYNFVFLRCQQNMANDYLHARGHVFLNEVYDNLGLQRSRAGAVVGWILSEDSDNYVDFGIFNAEGEARGDLVNGREGSILLDFNVDGVIFDKIREHGERLKWQS